MSKNLHYKSGHAAWKRFSVLLCSVAVLAGPVQAADAVAKPKGSLRVLTFNTWGERFSKNIGNMSEFFTAGDYDIIGMQELGNRGYASQLPGMLANQGLGTYKSQTSSDSGVLTRLEGSTSASSAGTGMGGNGGVALAHVNAQNGLPQMTVGATHLDWHDETGDRLKQAKALNALAQSMQNPFIITGDFNAGDLSERGLERSAQQALLYTHLFYDNNPSALWKQLGNEYAPDGKVAETQAYVSAMRAKDGNGQQHYRNVFQAYFDAHRDEFPNVNSIGDMSWQQWAYIVEKDMAANNLVLKDEMYPVQSNLPVTMNVLKKNYIMLVNEDEREIFAPLEAGDGRTTWTSSGEDDTNTWASWDHGQIDHFLAARPYGKWFKLADDPDDEYVGNLDDVGYGNDGTPLSDHDTVAHTIRWVGPVLQDVDGNPGKKIVTWGAEATTFGEEKTAYVAGDGKSETLDGNSFYLTRNNARTDVRLGQIADENGNPILEGLTLDEKKQVLDCYSTDARFQAAIAEYCIDDHSFIAETHVIDGGTVIVDEDAALGNSDASLHLDNGTLKIAGTMMTGLSRNVVLDGAGTLDVDNAANILSAPGVISGAGSLTKSGAGTLVLSAANTYQGGTLIAEGTLATLGGAALPDSSTVTIANAGTLSLGDSETIGGLAGAGRVALGGATLTVAPEAGSTDFGGMIDGSGMLVKSGNGELVLSGANTYTGGTLISAGRLTAKGGNALADNGGISVGAAGTLAIAGNETIGPVTGTGAIALDDGTLTVSFNGVNSAFDGVISGAGSLAKAGDGALYLTGTSTYTGETTVSGGALYLNGSIANSALTTVTDGGLLGGNGTLGSLRVANGGTVAPGNSIGLLTVAGDVTFDEGSTFLVELNADGGSDKIVATGTATINGGTLATVAANGNYRPDTSYTVLTAAGGVTGNFDAVTTDMAFLTPFFVNTGSGLSLDVVRNDLDFSAVATSRNSATVANTIEGVGPGTLYNAIIGLDAVTANAAFGQLSGDLYPSVMAGLAEDSHFFRDAVTARFSGGIAAAPAGGEADGRFSVWSHGYGASGKLEGNDVGTLDRNTGGFSFGGDAALNDTITLGAMAGYGRSSFDLDGANADADSYLIGAYGEARYQAFRLTFGGAYAFNDIDSHRTVNFGTFSDNLTASYDGSVGQVFAEAAYAFELGGGVLEPYLGLAQVHAETDGFTESGGAAALTVHDADMNVTYMDLGLRASKTFALGEQQARFTGELGWRHAFGDIDPEAAMAIAGSTPFTIIGTPVTEDAAIVSAGLNFDLTKNANLYVNYVGQFAGDSSENGVNAGLKVRF